METENSHEWQSDNFLPEDNNLHGDQDSEEAFEIIDSSKDEENCLQTPNHKLGLHDDSKDHHSEIDLSAGSLSSDISTKEGSEPVSSSSSSSDAESGAYKPHAKNYLLQEVNGEESLKPKNLEKEAETFHISYEELLEKVANNAAELTFTKKKLESSQEEIAKLKYENLTLVEELGGTIEKLRSSEDNMEKMEQKLRNKFHEDQHQLQNQLHSANQSIDQLQAELDSERKLVSDLKQTILNATIDLDNSSQEIARLKLASCTTEEEFLQERSRLQFDIAQLVQEKDELATRLKEVEITNNSLLDQVQQYEAKESGFLSEIKQLNSDLSEKCEAIHSLNKKLDASKLNYDMLMAEKDEVFAQVQTLAAEMTTRDISTKQMEDRVKQLVDQTEMAKRQVEELRAKVMDQDKELKQQVNIISDRAEEKREAIKQLCFALEYYRNGYHELRQAFSKTRTKRSLVLTS